jgi:hypothetical protein
VRLALKLRLCGFPDNLDVGQVEPLFALIVHLSRHSPPPLLGLPSSVARRLIVIAWRGVRCVNSG